MIDVLGNEAIVRLLQWDNLVLCQGVFDLKSYSDDGSSNNIDEVMVRLFKHLGQVKDTIAM